MLRSVTEVAPLTVCSGVLGGVEAVVRIAASVATVPFPLRQ